MSVRDNSINGLIYESDAKDMIFKELAYAETPLGELSLRLRTELKTGENVYEIKLNDEYLMSSMFTVAEEELARIGLADLNQPDLDVVVGGLGLGCTAKTALDHDNVKSLIVVEMLDDVIKWHREKTLPLGEALSSDKRCRMVQGDFFALVKGPSFDPDQVDRRFHAILLDIDHAPDFTLSKNHDGFYSQKGLTDLLQHLHPGGVFALWSNDPPDANFTDMLGTVFTDVEVHEVHFSNPLRDCKESNTVYVAKAAPAGY